MDTNVFNNCTGKKYSDTVSLIGSDWKIAHSDKYVHIFKHDNGNHVAILACDDDGFIRFCDVQKNKKSIYLYNGLYQCVSSYKDIVAAYNVNKFIENKYNQELPICTQIDQKTAFRNVYRKKRETVDRYSVPVFNNSKQWRTVSDNNGDSCTDFIIIPDRWTDDMWNSDEGYQQINDEVEELVFSTVGYRSCYDFPTGHMITISWGFKRVACGVAVIHCRGIDW